VLYKALRRSLFSLVSPYNITLKVDAACNSSTMKIGTASYSFTLKAMKKGRNKKQETNKKRREELSYM
jgi:hypothetical protein